MQIGYPVARLMIVALLLILCGTGSDLTAQYTSLGTDFTFGFLQNRTLDNGRSSTGGNGDVRVAIYVSNHSGRGPATVEISYSGADGAIEFEVDGLPVPSDGTTISVEVAPLSGRLVEFVPSAGHTPADLQIMGNGRRDRRSYRVRSDEPIALYAQSWQSASRDVSLILPKPSLGSDYVVAAPHPTPYARSRYGGPTEFAIVAVDDNTSVRFSLPRTVTVRLPGQPAESYPAGDHVIRLDAGETWQLQSDSLDLTGIRVHADDCRPFALYAGNMAVDVPTTSGGTWDHVYEQMFPRRSWGRRYVTTPVTDGVWDLFKIISAIDNTTVRIDGLELRTAEGPLRLAAGEVLEISDRVATSKGQVVTNAPTRIDRASYITSSAPVAVAQIGLSSAMHERSRRLDPFMIQNINQQLSLGLWCYVDQ